MSLNAREPGGVAADPSRPAAGSRRVRTAERRRDPALTVLAGLALITALYVGREIFIPLVLATLLAFLLGPLVRRLRRLGTGRVFSVALVVAAAVALLASLGFLAGTQVTSLVSQLPSYQRNVQTKLRALREEGQNDLILRATSMIQTLQAELDSTRGSTGAKPPVAVEIHQPAPTQLQLLQNLTAPLLQPIALAGLVIVFVIFLLLQREDLRDRVIRLAGAHDIRRTTAAFDDAGRRVSRYLLVQLVINAAFGLQIGTGLALIGIPNPLLWGLAAWVLRFVPLLGPILASVCPILLAIAVDPGWSIVVWTAALFLCVELVTGNLLEPLIYRQSTGLSPLAYIVSITFWAWLWGPIGLLVSTPLTVCVVVLGRHVPQFEPIAVLLGNEDVLAPEETFYQRLLAGDVIEATTQAETFLANRPLDAFFQEVAVPALALAQHDVDRAALGPADQQRLLEQMLTVIEMVSDLVDDTGDVDETALQRLEQDTPVLCVPGRGGLDMPLAVMIARLLAQRGIGTRISTTLPVPSRDEVQNVGIACQCFAHPPSSAYGRIAYRRLRRALLPRTQILLALFRSPDQVLEVELIGAETVTFNLRETVEKLSALVTALRDGAIGG